MKAYLKTNTDVAQCVEDLLLPLDKGSVLTMTISRNELGDYSVSSVTDASSEDIVTLLGQFYYDKLTSI
jgi:hypothetical protein